MLQSNSGLWAVSLFLIMAAHPAQAAAVGTDASGGGGGQDCAIVSFPNPDEALLLATSLCKFPGFAVQVLRLDLIFDAPPFAADITSCVSDFFPDCGAFTRSPGVTDVFFSTPNPSVSPGIPAGTPFLLNLDGFTPRQEIELVANAPEPPPATPLAVIAILAIIVSWRSRRAQSRDTRPTPAA